GGGRKGSATAAVQPLPNVATGRWKATVFQANEATERPALLGASSPTTSPISSAPSPAPRRRAVSFQTRRRRGRCYLVAGPTPLIQENLDMTNEELRKRVAELEEQGYGPPLPDEPEGWRGPPNGASREDLLALIRELEEELAG